MKTPAFLTVPFVLGLTALAWAQNTPLPGVPTTSAGVNYQILPTQEAIVPAALEAQRKDIKMEGQISGAFHDAGNANRLTTLKLSFEDNGTGSAGIAFATDKTGVYEVVTRFTSPKSNISAVQLGSNKKGGQGLSVILEIPTNVVTIGGTLPGSELDSLSLPWAVSVEPVKFGLPEGAKTRSDKEGYSFWGATTGQFMDLDKGKVSTATRDVNDDDKFGSLAIDYQGDYVIESKKPFKVFSFVTQNEDPLFKYSMLKEKVIVCVVDVPQTRVRLSGMIQGRKTVQNTIGWAVS